MRIILFLQYDGRNFCGWQTQPGERTVQSELEKAVKALTKTEVSVIASGRTDSGVHALCQVAHFDVDFTIPPEKYAPALNGILPPDIKVIKSQAAPNGFHARFSAKKKTYRYTFYQSETELPLYDGYAQQIYFADVKKMQEGAAFIEGEHDFKCFLASNSSVKDTVRTVYSCKVRQKGIFITVEVCGNGFLYNMVRTIAGTLLAVGQGRMQPDFVSTVISSLDRSLAGKTMPAKGLTLQRVYYKGIKPPKI